MKARRLPAIVLLAALAVVAIGACSGAAAPAATSAPVDEGTGGFPLEPPATAAPATAPAVAPASSPLAQPLIIYTGTLSLQVTDIAQAVGQADQVVVGLGGHIASSDMTNKDDDATSSVTYRIPVDKWDEALSALRAVGSGTKVLDESTQSQDVTGQVIDLNARIDNAKSSEAALQAIMARASSIPDVLTVQDKLSSVQGDIESMTAQRDQLADQAAYSTLTVQFQLPPVPETTVATGGWDLGHEVDNAVAMLVRIGQGLTTVLIWFVVVILPVVIPALIVFFIALWLRRRWLRMHPAPVMPGPPRGSPSL